MSTTRRTSLIVLALLFVLPLSGCGWRNWAKAERTDTYTLDHIPGSSLEVRTRNGSVEIVSAPEEPQVSIEAKLRARGNTDEEAQARLDLMTVRYDRDADERLLVQPVFPEPHRGGDGVSFVIKVPDAEGVVVDTGNGSVYLTGLGGDAYVSTSNGRIELEDHIGPAELNTSNGSVRVYHHTGEVEADTSNGSIRMSDVNGPVDAATSNGSIEVALAETQEGPLKLNTSNGSITVRVGEAFAGTVNFGTSNGSIRVRDPRGRITSTDIQKYRGRIVVGEGGEPSRLGTSNGGIRFTVSGS